MNFLTFLIASFATFRLALMLISEEGPAGAFSVMRRKIPAKTNAGRGVRCFFCISVYASALFTGLLYYVNEIQAWQTPIYWMGISGAAIAINWLDTK